MKKTILFLFAFTISVAAFSQTKPVTDTTKKQVKDSLPPVKTLAIIISENDLQVLSALLVRGISEIQKDPIKTNSDVQLHNALPTIHDYLLKNIISLDNASIVQGTGASVLSNAKKKK